MGVLDGAEIPGCELTGPALALVEAILAAPVAWRSPAHLRAATGLDEAAVFCGLADLEVAELVTHWETEAELTVTLTPIGAARLGVRMVEMGRNEIPRWAPIAAPEPPPPPQRGPFREYCALDFVPSRELDPAEALDLAEQLATADPSGGASAGEPCPACGSASRRAACAYCTGADPRPVRQLRRDRHRAARRGVRAREDRKARLKARFP